MSVTLYYRVDVVNGSPVNGDQCVSVLKLNGRNAIHLMKLRWSFDRTIATEAFYFGDLTLIETVSFRLVFGEFY